MIRPFVYGKPVTKPYFVDREKETELILDQIRSVKHGASTNLAVLGPRRVGKTSIIKNVMMEFEDDKEIIPIFIDCLSIPSMRRLSNVIAEDAKTSYIEKTGDTKYARKINEFIKKSVGEIISKVSELDVSISSYLSIKLSLQEAETDEDVVFENTLNYLEQLGKSKNVYFAVFLDEFSEIAEKWGDDFIKLFRTIVQQQTRTVYVLSSSAMTFMNNLVYSSRSPFYRQLKPISIGPLPQDVTKAYVTERFGLVEYSITNEALKLMLELTNCLPDYIQRMGDMLLDISEDRSINVGNVRQAYEDIFITLDPTFNLLFTKLSENSTTYPDIVVASAKFSKPSLIANDAGIPVTSLYYYMPYLINLGIIERVKKGQYQLIDPIFRDWIRNKFRLG
jgi:AAA+ ATPase superfamily predicted ATPase